MKPQPKPVIPGAHRYGVNAAYTPFVDWSASRTYRNSSYERARDAYAAVLAGHGHDPRAIAIMGWQTGTSC